MDDDAATRRLIVAALSPLTHEVVAARGAEEGLELFKKGPAFDLILSDLTMPVVSGLEFMKAVRLQNSTVPILVLSSMQTD